MSKSKETAVKADNTVPATPMKKDSKSQISAIKQSDVVTKTVDSLSTSLFETIQLVGGDSSKDSTVTNAAARPSYDLSVPGSNLTADPEEARDGQKTIVRYSKFSKRVSAKVANKLSDGICGIATVATDTIREAEDRNRGDSLVNANYADNYSVITPDTANFLLHLNVSGHIPLANFPQASSWAAHDADGLVPTVPAAGSRALRKINLGRNRWDYNIGTIFDADETNAFTRNNLSLSSVTTNVQKYNPAFPDFNLAINRSGFGDRIANAAAFDNDVDTYNFFTSFKRMFNNINAYSVESCADIPYVMKTAQWIYSCLIADIDFATFMYIMIDSWALNFSWYNVLGNKIGIADDTIRSILMQRRMLLLEGKDNLDSLKKVFQYLPVNNEVINSWNEIKNASKVGDSDIYSEDNMLLIPHFQILGNFIQKAPQSFRVAAHASKSPISLPSRGLIHEMLALTTNRLLSSEIKRARSGSFHGNGSTTVPSFDGHEETDLHSYAAVSAVRMTVFSHNLLYSCLFEGDITRLVESHFSTHREYYEMYKKSGIYEGSIYSFMMPNFPNFDSAPEATYSHSSVHVPYLMEINPNFMGFDCLPVIDSSAVNNATDLAYRLNHWVVYDKYSESAFVQKFVKGIVVSNLGQDADTPNGGGGVENDVHGNLVSVNLMSSIIVPFHDEGSWCFDMNITPKSSCNSLVFTQGVNQTLYRTAMFFEFIKWSNAGAQITNVSRTRRHVAGNSQATNYYLAADNMRAFSVRGLPIARSNQLNALGIPLPICQFSFSEKTAVIAADGILGYEHPNASMYNARWATIPFGSSSFGEFTMGGNEYLKAVDIKIG